MIASRFSWEICFKITFAKQITWEKKKINTFAKFWILGVEISYVEINFISTLVYCLKIENSISKLANIGIKIVIKIESIIVIY